MEPAQPGTFRRGHPTMPQLCRVAPILGACLLLTTLWLGAACTCDGPPRIEGCRDPITDFSGVTDASLVGVGIVMGPQGGAHFQYQIAATGTGLGRCIAYRSELLDAAGGVVGSLEGGVRADVAGTALTSSPIIHLNGFGAATTVRVTTLGRTLTAALRGPPDAGRPADAPELDAR